MTMIYLWRLSRAEWVLKLLMMRLSLQHPVSNHLVCIHQLLNLTKVVSVVNFSSLFFCGSCYSDPKNITNGDGKVQQSDAKVKQTDGKLGISSKAKNRVQATKRAASIKIKNAGTYELLLLLLSWLLNAFCCHCQLSFYCLFRYASAPVKTVRENNGSSKSAMTMDHSSSDDDDLPLTSLKGKMNIEGTDVAAAVKPSGMYTLTCAASTIKLKTLILWYVTSVHRTSHSLLLDFQSL